MAKIKIVFEIQNKQGSSGVTPVSHEALQKSKPKGISGTLFGRHVADLDIVTASMDMTYKKKTKEPEGISEFRLVARYSDRVELSKKIPKGSECFKLASAHEKEHQKDVLKGLAKVEKLGRKTVEAVLKAHIAKAKGDYAKIDKDTKAFTTAVAKEAWLEIHNKHFIGLLEASIGKIDTPSKYAPIDRACGEFI